MTPKKTPNSPKPKPRKAAPKVKATRIYTHVYEVVVENRSRAMMADFLRSCDLGIVGLSDTTRIFKITISTRSHQPLAVEKVREACESYYAAQSMNRVGSVTLIAPAKPRGKRKAVKP